MHRFYLPSEQCSGSSIRLSDRDAHHAAQVLRLRLGDVVTILDGVGHELRCKIETVDRKDVRLSVVEKKSVPSPVSKITLLQAVPKGKMFEWIIEKAVELGVARIVPLLTERTVTQIRDDASSDKQEKWQLTAIEAIKQCGQTWLPLVEQPVTLDKFLSRGEKFEMALVASLQPGARHARDYFHHFTQNESRSPATICIFVGPEGDFTPAEIKQIEASGSSPITLGPLILRCETAAIYSLAVINHEVQGSLQ